MTSDLLNIDELAAYLKVKKQTIYNWLHLKKISGIKMGHVWRFERRDIDSWLRAQHRKAGADPEQERRRAPGASKGAKKRRLWDGNY